MGAEHIYAVDYMFEFNDTEFVVWHTLPPQWHKKPIVPSAIFRGHFHRVIIGYPIK